MPEGTLNKAINGKSESMKILINSVSEITNKFQEIMFVIPRSTPILI